MRARNLKPGFFKNEDLAELPFEARLLFEGLWCMADREGRLEDRPKRIKAELFPYDDLDIEKLLEQLRTARFILRYQVEGYETGFITIPTFKRHQNPHKNEKPSELPAPGDIAKLREDSGTKTELIGLNPSSLNPESSSASAVALRPLRDGQDAGTLTARWVDKMREAERVFTSADRGRLARYAKEVLDAGLPYDIATQAVDRIVEKNLGPHLLGQVANEIRGSTDATKTPEGKRKRYERLCKQVGDVAAKEAVYGSVS